MGSNFLDEHSMVAGIGPVSVDPPVMNRGIGRKLMPAVMDRAAEGGFPGVRLVQVAWHCRSLALYTRLGFDVRETPSAMQGPPLVLRVPGYDVRPARTEDLAACTRRCRRVHGQGKATVVERVGRVTGYATGIGWFEHAVAETNDDWSGPGL